MRQSSRAGSGVGRRAVVGAKGALAAAFLAAAAPGQHELFEIGIPDTFFNQSVVVDGVGDVDGDGHADLLYAYFLDHNNNDDWDQEGMALLSGLDGRELLRFASVSGINTGVIQAVMGAGDLNGDGILDVVFGAPGTFTVGDHGYVRGFSGKDGSILFTLIGPLPDDRFGEDLEALGDVDGDGAADFAVWARGRGLGVGCGSRIYSGASRALLYEYTATCPRLRAAGDVNGDGHADFFRLEGDTAVLASGADGTTLASFVTTNGIGWVDAAPAGDVDADGVGDFVLGDWIQVQVFSGADGRRLHALQAGQSSSDDIFAQYYFATRVAGPGDVNGDGFADFACNSYTRVHHYDPVKPPEDGRVWVFSGLDGAVLFSAEGPDFYDGFGQDLNAAGDVDGDGVGDLVVAASGSFTAHGIFDPAVWVLSGAPLALTTDVPAVELGAGEAQTLFLDAGPEHAFQPYRVLGSATGTQPGVPLGGALLPLNPDRYFRWTRTVLGPPPLTRAAGLLDAEGQAIARFAPDPGPGSLPGLFTAPVVPGRTHHHAFVVLDDASGAVRFTSNARPVVPRPGGCDVAPGVADCDGDDVADSCQIEAEPALDCNENGVLDACEVASGVAADCDGNGVPDECDPDLDRDGVPDACE